MVQLEQVASGVTVAVVSSVVQEGLGVAFSKSPREMGWMIATATSSVSPIAPKSPVLLVLFTARAMFAIESCERPVAAVGCDGVRSVPGDQRRSQLTGTKTKSSCKTERSSSVSPAPHSTQKMFCSGSPRFKVGSMSGTSGSALARLMASCTVAWTPEPRMFPIAVTRLIGPICTLACADLSRRVSAKKKHALQDELTQIGTVMARSVKVVRGMLAGSPAAEAELSMAMGAIKAKRERELKRMLTMRVGEGEG